MRKLAVLAALFGTIALLGTGIAAATNTYTVVTMDELSPRPANGVHLKGVTFNYEEFGSPSNAATFNFIGPGTTAYTTPPGLEGPTDSAKLTATWDQPTPAVQFAIAFSTSANTYFFLQWQYGNGSLSPVRYVYAFPQGFFFSETQVRYFPGGTIGNIKKMIITFPSSAGVRFDLDNLTYNQGGSM